MGPDTDFSSSQLMRLIHLGDPSVVLNSKAIWICSSCQACTTRCPMGIDIAAVMDALRILAVERKTQGAAHNARKFNRSFLASVKRHARVYEMGLMTAYKLRSLSFFSDVDKAPRMLAKGKLRLLFKKHKEIQAVRELFNRAEKEEESR